MHVKKFSAPLEGVSTICWYAKKLFPPYIFLLLAITISKLSYLKPESLKEHYLW